MNETTTRVVENAPWQTSDGERVAYALITHLPGGAGFVLDRELRYVLAGGDALESAGFTPADFLGKSIFEVLDPALSESYEPFLRRALAGEPFTHEHASHGRIYLSHSVPLRDESGAVYAVLVLSYDITERKQASDLLERRVSERTHTLEERTAELTEALASLEAAFAQRRSLTARLARAQEEERRRISRELHDQMGQHLTAFSLGLKSLESTCGTDESGTRELIAHLRAVALEMGRDIHRVAVGLRPTSLDDLGLTPSLGAYIEAWQEISGIPAELQLIGSLSEDAARFSTAVETAAYRVVQEALTNVARHAVGATFVGVTLQRRGGDLLVTVEDDGPGFDVQEAGHSVRLGMLGMRERAEQAGGTLEIESEPGTGTTIFLRLPIV